MAFNNTRKWNAFWITTDKVMNDWRKPVLPAPFFRKNSPLTMLKTFNSTSAVSVIMKSGSTAAGSVTVN